MKFKSFNLKEQLTDILTRLGYENATKVQEVVIPKALKYENIIAKSETGSGKTHSFLVPILNNVKFNKKIQAIIVVPSRELARQTYQFIDDVRRFEYYKNLSVKMFVSGEDSKKDKKSFLNGAEIVIATPGKLNDLLDNSSIDLTEVKTIVLDEADMLIDDTFVEEIDKIFDKIGKNCQIEVFSATINNKVKDFLRKYISPDFVVTISEDNTSSNVAHYFINTKHNDRYELILKFIDIANPYLLLIFASSRDEVKNIHEFLASKSTRAGILSGDLEARERKAMLRRIKNEEFRVVVCSDLASRGLDIEDVSEVLNFDLPNNLEYYYHRAGRCGRNNKKGACYSFFDNDTLKIPLKLINQGLKAEIVKIQDDAFVKDQIVKEERKKKKIIDGDLERDIKKAKALNMGKKVKPGYKKKVKNAIDKVKRKHKREIIKNDIKRQRLERYKKANQK